MKIRFYLLSKTPTTHLVRDRATDTTCGHFTDRRQAEAYRDSLERQWNSVTRVTTIQPHSHLSKNTHCHELITK